MWPWLRDGFAKFFTDKTYFQGKWDRWVAKVRGTIMASGLVSAFYADQLSDALKRPEWNDRIKIASIALAAASLLLRAGDKTPEDVKKLAADYAVNGKAP